MKIQLLDEIDVEKKLKSKLRDGNKKTKNDFTDCSMLQKYATSDHQQYYTEKERPCHGRGLILQELILWDLNTKAEETQYGKIIPIRQIIIKVIWRIMFKNYGK